MTDLLRLYYNYLIPTTMEKSVWLMQLFEQHINTYIDLDNV